MCMGMKKPVQPVREDPTIKFVDGNKFDPKALPPEIEDTPVLRQEDKVNNNVTSQPSDLNINTTTY